jgi:hypothetical protein
MLTSFTGKKLTNKDTCNWHMWKYISSTFIEQIYGLHSKCFRLKIICQMIQITHFLKSNLWLIWTLKFKSNHKVTVYMQSLLPSCCFYSPFQMLYPWKDVALGRWLISPSPALSDTPQSAKKSFSALLKSELFELFLLNVNSIIRF